jgi:hypothetical protein
MRTIQTQELATVSGGCQQAPDGSYYDVIEVAPGVFMPVPCQHAQGGPVAPKRGTPLTETGNP